MLIKIQESEYLLERIVKAVEKAIGEDVREYLAITNKATNNAVRIMRSDNINTNLRDNVASDIIELRYFKRSVWTGCLLIDRQHKTTYTICTKRTLESIPRKHDRCIPHYLQSILYVQNANVEASYGQMSFGDYYPDEWGTLFSDEEYRNDYQSIMGDDVTFDDNYTHLVVAYEAENFSITSIVVKLLDPNFRTAQEYSLMNLLKPDFSELTIVESHEQAQKDSRNLVAVKEGLKKQMDKVTQQETIITLKKTEEAKQI